MTDKDDRRKDDSRPWDKASKGGAFSSAFSKDFGKGKPKQEEISDDSKAKAQKG